MTWDVQNAYQQPLTGWKLAILALPTTSCPKLRDRVPSIASSIASMKARGLPGTSWIMATVRSALGRTGATRTMEIRTIRTKADCRSARSEIETRITPRAGAPQGERLDAPVTLVEVYEEKHYRSDLPDLVEAIKFRMEQLGGGAPRPRADDRPDQSRLRSPESRTPACTPDDTVPAPESGHSGRVAHRGIRAAPDRMIGSEGCAVHVHVSAGWRVTERLLTPGVATRTLKRETRKAS